MRRSEDRSLEGSLCGAETQVSEEGSLPSKHLRWLQGLVWKEARSKAAAAVAVRYWQKQQAGRDMDGPFPPPAFWSPWTAPAWKNLTESPLKFSLQNSSPGLAEQSIEMWSWKDKT